MVEPSTPVAHPQIDAGAPPAAEPGGGAQAPVPAEGASPAAGAEAVAPAGTPPAEAAEQPQGEAPAAEAPPAESKKRWYVVKVQSGREESIKEAIERRVKI